MAGLFVVVGLTLLISAVCSLFEATLYSTRMAALEAAYEEGRHRAAAQQFIRFKRNIGVPTSAILILNTVANTSGATVAGMLAADVFGSNLIGVFSGLLTLTILFVAEILPKTFGATHWKTLWPVVVWPLTVMEKALRPFIWVTQGFAGLFVKNAAAPVTTQDEIVAMIRMGADSGELTSTEHRLIRSVFRFDELQARDVMLSRRDVVTVDAMSSVRDCLKIVIKTKHTRYPLCVGGSLDEVLGVVHVKDLLGRPEDDPTSLTSLTRPMVRVPETMLIRVVLREMQRSQPHMAAVVDERGTVVGVITLEQVLEQLVGSVRDEFDEVDLEFVADGPGAWLVKGTTPLTQVSELLGLKLANDEVSTLSGLVMSVRGQLPSVGDVIDVEGGRIEVVEVRRDRAEKLRVVVADATDESEELDETPE